MKLYNRKKETKKSCSYPTTIGQFAFSIFIVNIVYRLLKVFLFGRLFFIPYQIYFQQ